MIKGSFLEKYNMLPQGSKVLCAVSGGADSMCLLHMLLSRQQDLGIHVAAAHYEHGLRGEESLRDAKFVENFCVDNGIEFICGHGDVRSYAKEKAMSIEEAARELRYAFLQQAAEKLGCDKIATAHNADDNAETLIFNLCRGSGSAGLSGIPPVRDNIIRPLLTLSRDQIEAYLLENNVPHVHDSSNDSDDYSRNLIRHHVSPVLKGINPAFAASACRTAELMRQDEDCLNLMAEEFIRNHYENGSLPQAELKKLHEAVSSRVFRKLCPKALDMDHVRSLMKLIDGSEYSCVNVPGAKIVRERGKIYFQPPEVTALADRVLPIDGTLDLPEAGLRIHTNLEIFEKEVYGLFNNFLIKYENIRGVLCCTCRRDGDRLRPIGRNCTKSLKALFNEKKMTQAEKMLCPVIRDDEGVLAVYGFAADERSKPQKGDRVLRITIEKY